MRNGGTVEQWNSGTVDRGISEDAEWRNILKRRMPFCLNKSLKKLNLIKKKEHYLLPASKIKRNWITYKRKIIYHWQEKLKEA